MNLSTEVVGQQNNLKSKKMLPGKDWTQAIPSEATGYQEDLFSLVCDVVSSSTLVMECDPHGSTEINRVPSFQHFLLEPQWVLRDITG